MTGRPASREYIRIGFTRLQLDEIFRCVKGTPTEGGNGASHETILNHIARTIAQRTEIRRKKGLA